MSAANRERVLAAALACLLALTVFHPGVAGDLLRAWVVVGGGLLLGALAWRRHRDPDEPRRGDLLPVLAVGVVVTVAALQLVPLPRGLVRLLAPATAAIYDLEQAGRGASEAGFRPLSLEPGATLRAALLALALLAVFLVARTAGRERRAATALVASLALTGAGCAVFALAHQAATPEGPWRGRARAPFVNPNHLATLLILCLGPTLGLLLTRERRRSARAGLLAVGAVLIVVGLIATRSRGGFLAAGGAAALALLAALGSGRSPRRTVGAIAAGVAVLAIGWGLSDAEPLERRLDRGGVALSGRVANWRAAGRVIATHPWAGSGLGTFDDASRAVVDPARQRLTRPGAAHNDYLELAATCGVPAALLALLLLGAGVAPAAREALRLEGSRRGVAIGCFAGAAGAALQAGVDFGLTIPGPGLVFATCLGLGCGATRQRRPTTTALRPRLRQAARIAGSLALILAGGLLVLQSAREARARAAHEAAHAPNLSPTLRQVLAQRALTPLREAAASPLARAEVHFRRAEAAIASQPAWKGEVRAAAAAAVRAAPGRAEHQAQLAVVLLNLACAGSRTDPDLLREAETRLRLAVALSPAQPQILRTALDAELALLIRTGAEARVPRVEALIRQVRLHDPGGQAWVEALLGRRSAALGARARPLLEAARRPR